ncbi:MAG: hypothetical protein MAG451_00343 [Anaerolineales bacterium]|nr:hypothetical protein [Anaerolineales bacterium]
MKVSYDTQVDALYIEFHKLDPGTAEARQLTDDIIANYDPDGKLAGLEILDVSETLQEINGQFVFELAPALVKT